MWAASGQNRRPALDFTWVTSIKTAETDGQPSVLLPCSEGTAVIMTGDGLPASNQSWVSMVLLKPGPKHEQPGLWWRAAWAQTGCRTSQEKWVKVKRSSRKVGRRWSGDLINEARLRMKPEIMISYNVRMSLVIWGFQARRHSCCVHLSFYFVVCELFWSLKTMRHISSDFYCISKITLGNISHL